MITIFCHLYHQHLWDEINGHLKKIIYPKKLYFNLVNDQGDLTHIKNLIRKSYPDAVILVSPNQGRDCGGNLRLIDQWLKDGAPGELIIQCHSKTNHAWRSELFHPVFDRPDYLRYLFSDASVGMVGSNHWLLSCYADVNMGHYNNYRNRFNMSLGEPMTFIGGTVFCVRASIYKDFFSKYNPIQLANELEHGAINEPSNTHAMERIFGGIIGHMGYIIRPANYAKGLLDLFDEQYYLEAYPDVKASIGHKIYSGFSHFLRWGIPEHRNMNSMTFDEKYYLDNNKDITRDGYGHFLTHGHAENRQLRFIPNQTDKEIVFDEKYYLTENPDVASSMQRGWPRTAYEHFLLNGKTEGRKFRWRSSVLKLNSKNKYDKSLCVFCHYSTSDKLPKYVEYYLKELSRHFDDVKIVCNNKINTTWDLTVYENEGLDFGMYKKKLADIQESQYSRIALVNDSAIIFNSLKHIFNWALASRFDMWGLTDSHESMDIREVARICPQYIDKWLPILKNSHHIQSYFLVFEKNTIPHLLDFFRKYEIHNLDSERLRMATVIEGEMNLSKTVIDRGFKVGSFVKAVDNTNLHVRHWRKIILDGLPMIKKKIVNGEFSKIVQDVDFDDWHLFVQRHMNFNYEELFSSLI